MVRWHPTMDILFFCSYDNIAKKSWLFLQISLYANKIEKCDQIVIHSLFLVEDADGDWDCVQTLGESSNGHCSTVWPLVFNAKGDKLVTCGDDLTLKIWEADIIRMQSGDGDAPWLETCHLKKMENFSFVNSWLLIES
ncbi:hypothetical protein CXB51_022615 [Gossypium anomalum]|uniref:Uncharacterized protein n=1 Tax=Gossypium anomalum TaxID=47600 RepID=A0A8J5YW66_9ROSI|nr:hypothetical protein CXB51_022615 [Gossypium anomalum]